MCRKRPAQIRKGLPAIALARGLSTVIRNAGARLPTIVVRPATTTIIHNARHRLATVIVAASSKRFARIHLLCNGDARNKREANHDGPAQFAKDVCHDESRTIAGVRSAPLATSARSRFVLEIRPSQCWCYQTPNNCGESPAQLPSLAVQGSPPFAVRRKSVRPVRPARF